MNPENETGVAISSRRAVPGLNLPARKHRRTAWELRLGIDAQHFFNRPNARDGFLRHRETRAQPRRPACRRCRPAIRSCPASRRYLRAVRPQAAENDGFAEGRYFRARPGSRLEILRLFEPEKTVRPTPCCPARTSFRGKIGGAGFAACANTNAGMCRSAAIAIRRGRATSLL